MVERQALINEVAAIVLERAAQPRSGPFVVGINGVDAAGKSRFAGDLRDALGAVPTCLVPLDDFHHPRAVRNGGPDPVANYLERTFDFARFEREVLIALRASGGLDKTFQALDLRTDRFDRKVTYRASPDSIVLIEGVFLFRPQWRPFFDLRIFLSVEEAVSRERGIDRDRSLMGAEVAARYDTKYLPAQRLYLSRGRPADHADILIDANDWTAPTLLRPQ